VTEGVRDLFADLGLRPRLQGRAEIDIDCEYVRDLTPEDMEKFSVERGIQAPDIKRLTDSHHAVARALASGMKPGAVAVVTGYSPSRISILMQSPAFVELVEFYRKDADSAWADVQVRMSLLSLDSIQLLATRGSLRTLTR
jgi:hypothetical protein